MKSAPNTYVLPAVKGAPPLLPEPPKSPLGSIPLWLLLASYVPVLLAAIACGLQVMSLGDVACLPATLCLVFWLSAGVLALIAVCMRQQRSRNVLVLMYWLFSPVFYLMLFLLMVLLIRDSLYSLFSS